MGKQILGVALLAALVAACGSPSDGGSPSTTLPTATSPPISTTTTTEPPSWPAEPAWAQPGIDYLEAYRSALESGDLDAVFPYLHDGVAWFDGATTRARNRIGLRDTLIGLTTRSTQRREPGPIFVRWFVAAEDEIGFAIDWVHRTGDIVQNLRLEGSDDRVSLHRATTLVSDARRSVSGPDIQDLDLVEKRYVDIAERFSSGDAGVIAAMISDNTIFIDDGTGQLVPFVPREAFLAEFTQILEELPMFHVETTAVADLGLPGRDHAAVFFTPKAHAEQWFGPGAIGGTGIYRLRPVPEVELLVALDWVERNGEIVNLQFAWDPVTQEHLSDEAPPLVAPEASYWPKVPPPAQQRTATMQTAGGTIDLYNATPEHEELVAWALDRFAGAGLDAPVPNSIGFPPNVDCALYAGLAIDTGAGVDLQLCFDVEEMCTGDFCEPATTVRSTLLHELAHVWTSHNVDKATQALFLDVRGLDVWDAERISRDESGTEHAAEILAWGLIDEDTWTARLPDNDCSDLTAAFRILTGTEPLRVCE